MDFSKFKTSDWLKVGGAAAFIVFGFFPWVKVSFGGVSDSGENVFSFFWTGILPWILIVGIGVVTFLMINGTIKKGTLPWPLIMLGASALALLGGFAGDLAAILTSLEERDVLFIDEIHRLNRAVEEILYPAMEDYALDVMIGKGPSARSLRLSLKPFTVVGATTRAGRISSPLRDRFGATYRLDFYSDDELMSIVDRSAVILGVHIDDASQRDHERGFVNHKLN